MEVGSRSERERDRGVVALRGNEIRGHYATVAAGARNVSSPTFAWVASGPLRRGRGEDSTLAAGDASAVSAVLAWAPFMVVAAFFAQHSLGYVATHALWSLALLVILAVGGVVRLTNRHTGRIGAGKQ